MKDDINSEEINFWNDENSDQSGLVSEESGETKDKEAVKEENVIIPMAKIVLAKKLIQNIKENSEQLNNILAPFISSDDEARISIGQLADEEFKKAENEDADGRVIEGVFDGEGMVGPDGKLYSVPANYASKSKLVEGDIMKLTITPSGTFMYKQIGPIDRDRIVGRLEKGIDGNFSVSLDGKRWRILTASVTYYKGQSGDEAVILVPKTGESKWAAVENIIRNKE